MTDTQREVLRTMMILVCVDRAPWFDRCEEHDALVKLGFLTFTEGTYVPEWKGATRIYTITSQGCSAFAICQGEQA